MTLPPLARAVLEPTTVTQIVVLTQIKGEPQSRTDRIVFKLFDKNPNHFPLALRSQILDWLSHSPTEIESYIRPGCIILTIYLRLTESKWEELSNDLGSSLSRLLDVSDNNFWKTGWIYSRVQHRVAFIYNGQIVLDTSLTLEGHNRCRISSVTPIAVSVSDATQFVVKGFNLFQNTTRLLCALEGSYLLQKDTNELVDSDDMKEHVEFESLRFDCPVPELTGRGFVEVEDDGLSNGFFPFVVANQEMCSEIRMLESVIEVVDSIDDVHLTSAKVKARSQALDFIHEIGWLLHRSHLRFGLGEAGSNSDVFSFSRFRWIIEFSVDHDWCAVVKNLLDILFDGTVGLGEHTSVELALSDLGLLHRAVRRNCRKMVDLLLHYVPDENLDISGSKSRHLVNRSSGTFLFRPDVDGPAGLTPLHVAASRDCSENVLDALTDDPGLVGILGWKNACDSTGSTPEDYARQRGNYSYIHLVHRKISKKSNTSHIILDIPSAFQIEKCESRPVLIQRSCKLCNHQLASGSLRRAPAFYRPAMLSMLAIAAVCVCVGLLFKSTFRWELLNYGYY
ncbi:hypothetical protein GIB67_024809 [Kingdonia uniflora]|uniref:Uncharacterized protein n=1 Tax=Kingdonia uniflora TaxID=39325 RepID=A0A7J7NYE6_9MAGN|nr:hypothetical protein GIB67_024809 [Kingdonia uniflora]